MAVSDEELAANERLKELSLENLHLQEDRYDQVKNITAEIQKQGEMSDLTAQGWRTAFSDIASSSETAAKNWDEINLGAKTNVSIEKDIQKAKDASNKLQTRQSSLLSKAGLNAKQIEKVKKGELKLTDDIVKKMGKLSSEEKDLLKNSRDGLNVNKDNIKVLEEQQKLVESTYTPLVKGLQGLSGMAKKIGLEGPAKAMGKAAESARQAKVEGKGFTGQLAAAGKEMMNLNLLGIALSLLKMGLAYDKALYEMSTSMAITLEDASTLRMEMSHAATETGDFAVNTDKMQENMMKMQQGMGFFMKASAANLVTSVKLSEYYGLNAKQLQNMEKSSILTGKTQKQLVKEVNASTAEYRKQSGLQISLQKTMQQVNNLSGQMKLNLGISGTNAANFVNQMVVLGTTMENVKATSASLLNFEQSINAELEAELLTGKQINLEKARLYALTGDYEALAVEIANQAGSFSEYGDMNVLQQEALAKAFGMSADAMSEMLMEQEIAGRSAEELRAAGEDDLAKLVEKKDTQEEFLLMVEKMKVLFVDIIGPFIQEWLENFKDGIRPQIEAMVKKFGTFVKDLKGAGILSGDFFTKIKKTADQFKKWGKYILIFYGTLKSVRALLFIIQGIQTVIALARAASAASTVTENTAETAGLAAKGTSAALSGTKAAAEVTAASAMTLGIGTVAIIAGVAAVLGFLAAQAFHDGGVVGAPPGASNSEEVPAILNKDEIVLNENQQAETLMAIARGGGSDSGAGDPASSPSMNYSISIDSDEMSSHHMFEKVIEKGTGATQYVI